MNARWMIDGARKFIEANCKIELFMPDYKQTKRLQDKDYSTQPT